MRELLEGEARDLGHHVVDGRLEAGRGLAGDVVADLVEQVAHRQFGGDLGDRETGRLGSEGRAAADPRVHLDDDDAPGVRMHAELDVRAARLDTHGADHRKALIAEHLVLLVGQRLDRGHRDGVTRVHTHRVEVLDGADDDAVVGAVAHDLHLVLLPAKERFFHEDFADRGQVESALGDLFELLAVVADAAAGAAEGISRPDDERIAADPGRDGSGLFESVRRTADGDIQTDGQHQVFKNLTVFAFFDGVGLGADHLHIEPLERA